MRAVENAGLIQLCPVPAALPDRPEVAGGGAGTRTEGDRSIPRVDALVREYATPVPRVRPRGSLEDDRSGRAIDLEVRPVLVLRPVLQQDDRVGQVGVLRGCLHRQGDGRSKPVQELQRHRMRMPYGDLVVVGVRDRELDPVAGAEHYLAGLARWGADCGAARAGGLADGTDGAGPGKVSQQHGHRLVVNVGVANRHRHQQLGAGQGGCVRGVLVLPPVEIDAASIERQGEDRGQQENGNRHQDDCLAGLPAHPPVHSVLRAHGAADRHDEPAREKLRGKGG